MKMETIEYNIKTDKTIETVLEIDDNILLVERKKSFLQGLKENGKQVVFEKHNVHNQINAALGVYGTSERTAIFDWIKRVKKVVDDVEAQIQSASTLEELNIIDISFAYIKAQAEAITVY